MINILKEDADFKWGKIKNRYGYEFPCPELTDGNRLMPISEPAFNSVVYTFDDNTKELKLILIKEGDYEVDGRISNFWYWYELDENLEVIVEKHGYGNFFKPVKPFRVKIKYEISQ